MMLLASYAALLTAAAACLMVLFLEADLSDAGAASLKDASSAPGAALPDAERYLWFPLHSGASNQLLGIKAALMLGAILNRTVVMPPLPQHLAIWYNHCSRRDENAAVKAERVIEVSVTKDRSGELGLNVSTCSFADHTCLKIKGVKATPIETWNRANPDKTVEMGDLVIEVNGVKGDSNEMLNAMRSGTMVKFKVQKARIITDRMADDLWMCQERLLNHSLNLSVGYFQKGRLFRAVTSAYDFGSFEVPIKDMFDFYYDTCRGKLSIHMGCGEHPGRLPVVAAGKGLGKADKGVGISDTLKWRNVADVRNAWDVSPFREAPVLAVGSTFRMKTIRYRLDLTDTPSPWLREVLFRLMFSPVPFSRPLVAAAESVSGLLKSYSAFHLRFPDEVAYSEERLKDTGVWAASSNRSNELVAMYARWASRRLREASVPVNSSIYIATNVQEGCRHRGFKQLCSMYNCFCLAGGMSSDRLKCKAGLCDGALQNLTGIPEEDLMSVIDKQLCVLADQGFWPTSGMCYSCSDEECPLYISPTFANDVIKRRVEDCRPSCTGGPFAGWGCGMRL